MKRIIKYRSFDDKEFNTESECLAYEAQCEFISACKDTFDKFIEEAISKSTGKKEFASYWGKLEGALYEIHNPNTESKNQNPFKHGNHKPCEISLEETSPGAIFQCVNKDSDAYPDIYVSLNAKKINSSPYIRIANKLALGGYIPVCNITKQTLHFRAPSTRILLLGAVPEAAVGF